MSLLETASVTRRFGTFVAVDGVSMAVDGGEVVGLIGANGSGKTTLIRMALGVLPPSTGSVSLFGRPPSRAARARVGYVPQSLGLYDDLTVAENLSFAARAFGRRADLGALDPELRSASATLVGDLPLGIRRRAAFAQALAHEPELLVLDEPTSGVEPLARARLWETIRSAAERGIGVLATTHFMSEAGECDWLIVLVGGRVAASGTAEKIIGGMRTVVVEAANWESAFTALDAAHLPLALVGRSIRLPDGDPMAARELLARAGVEAHIEMAPASFDEAFVTIARRLAG
jgi:ABC-2 type transport system ATP-binding protein/ribosome-dependent ATPase